MNKGEKDFFCRTFCGYLESSQCCLRSVLCLTPGASAGMKARFWMPVGVRELENGVRREP